MQVKKNPYVEAWVAGRETLEERFRFTPRNIRTALLFGVLVPYGIYLLVAHDMAESKSTDRPEWKHLKREFPGVPVRSADSAQHS
jgi:hypothetical protein